MLMARAGGKTPTPKRVTISGLLVALVVTVRVPVRGPAVVGLKVMPIVQLLLLFKEAGQLFVWLKLPVIVMLLIFRAPPPLFVSVTV